MSDGYLVLCTVPDEEVAERLAKGLVGARLAACVNVVPGVRSFYVWDGAVQEEAETVLILKTREALVDALRFLRERDLVLIDLPGFAPGQIGLLEQAEARAELGPILRHAVLPADGRAVLAAELATGAHYLALTRGDLDDPLRLALDLTAGGRPLLSFVSSGADGHSPLALAGPEGLLAGLRGRLRGARGAAGAGAGR